MLVCGFKGDTHATATGTLSKERELRVGLQPGENYGLKSV